MRIMLQFPTGWGYGDEVGMVCMKQKKAFLITQKGLIKNRQRLTLPGFTLVPSALVGLTALFGMGRGDPHRYCHLKIGADLWT